MSQAALLRQCRRPTLRAWVGALLVAFLLLAETFAVTHPNDAAPHSNGQSCEECLLTASFGAAAAATPLVLHVPVPVPLLAAVVILALFSAAPARRYARGPPIGSFTL
jgi:hypothetical protein